MCELVVGLGDVELVGVDDAGEGAPLVVVIRSRKARPVCEVLWEAGVVQGVSHSRVGGPAGVRPAGSAAVAEASLDVSEPWARGSLVR